MEDAKRDLPQVDEELLERRMDQVERCVEALRSGTAMSAFCRAEHVSPRTVETWAERLGVELPGRGDDGGWVAVELPAPTAAPAPIEVVVSGALVRVPAGSSRADVECVLSALAAIS